MSDAKYITSELRGHWFGQYGVAMCPAHNNTNTPALSLKNGQNGNLLTHCHAGCTFQDVRAALCARGLIPDRRGAFQPIRLNRTYPSAPTSDQRITAIRKAKHATDLWQSAHPTKDTLADRYLRRRGITCALPPTLRALPDCRHPSGTQMPAMIARVEGAISFAVHRTFLSGPDKTTAHPAKAMLGSCKGGSVHLSSIDAHSAGAPLVVTEGIENGLSLLSGLLDGPATVWAALSTSGIVSLTLPRRAGHLIIAADSDAAGQQAARKLSIRADGLGWRISHLTPPIGKDWNDILLQNGSLK